MGDEMMVATTRGTTWTRNESIAITSVASISSRIRIAPNSAAKALPPWAATKTPANTGASSRKTATLMSEDNNRCAPNISKIVSPWRAITMPNGKMTAMTGIRHLVVIVYVYFAASETCQYGVTMRHNTRVVKTPKRPSPPIFSNATCIAAP